MAAQGRPETVSVVAKGAFHHSYPDQGPHLYQCHERRRQGVSGKQYVNEFSSLIPCLECVFALVADRLTKFTYSALARYDETSFGEVWLTRQPNFNMARLDPFLASHSKDAQLDSPCIAVLTRDVLQPSAQLPGWSHLVRVAMNSTGC